jgi:predicted small integral membrane protein
VLVTAGLSVAVFGITQANSYGWGSGKTVGIFAAAVALLAGFAVWETGRPIRCCGSRSSVCGR